MERGRESRRGTGRSSCLGGKGCGGSSWSEIGVRKCGGASGNGRLNQILVFDDPCGDPVGMEGSGVERALEDTKTGPSRPGPSHIWGYVTVGTSNVTDV